MTCLLYTSEGGWVKILLPEREGYVCGDYLTISDTSTGDGSFSLSLGEDELCLLYTSRCV